MPATVNRLLFTTTKFDSGSLGMLTSVIHCFSKPGTYEAVIHHGGKPAGTRIFEVAEDAAEMQLNIDLAGTRLAAPHKDDCCCKTGKNGVPRVSPQGFVLFFVSQGQGYSVVAGPLGQKARAEFNSQNLGAGDLFALSLLEPAKYSMVNRKGGAKGVIEVAAPKARKQALGVLDAQYVEVGSKGFKPARLKTTSTQGIVFRVARAARIVIERQGRRSYEKTAGPIRFRPLKAKAAETAKP